MKSVPMIIEEGGGTNPGCRLNFEKVIKEYVPLLLLPLVTFQLFENFIKRGSGGVTEALTQFQKLEIDPRGNRL